MLNLQTGDKLKARERRRGKEASRGKTGEERGEFPQILKGKDIDEVGLKNRLRKSETETFNIQPLVERRM